MKKKRIRVSEFFCTLIKLWKIMRLSLCFILFFIAQTWAVESFSQEIRLTMNLRNVKVIDVLNKIENETDYFFLFNQKLVNVDRIVNVEVRQEKVEEILSLLFEGTNVDCILKDRQIVLTTGTDNDQIMQQQQRKVSGIVTDENGQPLPGVTVVVKGTTSGTITGADGNYMLNNVPPDAILMFSFVGMKTREIEVANKAVVDMTLEEESFGIEEVVAIGYGTVKKSNLTSSVSKITTEAMKDRPIMLLGEAFQGQLAGVRSQASGGGVPGEELTIRIRGMNTINGDSSPLYVIDGVPRNNMSDINPNDIASIQVLKDASATSIYGARGGNGVVLIETKHGKGKPTVTFDAYYGLSNSEKKLDIMNGEEWVAWNMFRRNLKHLRAGGSMSDPMSSRLASNQIPESWATTTTFTDWQDAVLQTAPIQNYQLSASADGDIGNI